MKKLLAILIAMMTITMLFAGCGNMGMGLGNYTYKRIHIDTYHYSGCLTIEKWYESGSGVEVLTTEVGSVFASEGTYILLDGDKDCPFCAGGE